MSDILDTPEMREAENKLRRGLAEIFSKLPLVPDGQIAHIHTAEYAEDRETFIVWLDMADGREVYMQFALGDAISVSVRDVG